MAYDFGVTGGCKESREVIIKAWLINDKYYRRERTVYHIAALYTASPVKGCPSLIKSGSDPSEEIYVLVVEKLGPSLEDLSGPAV